MSNSNTSTRINNLSGANSMRRLWLLPAAAIGALAAAAAMAGPQSGFTEAVLESGTDLLTLPGVPGGTLTARECSVCETFRLSFDANTRYYIGNQAVSYVRLREVASNGAHNIYVVYRPDTKALTGLRLDAGADHQSK